MLAGIRSSYKCSFQVRLAFAGNNAPKQRRRCKLHSAGHQSCALISDIDFSKERRETLHSPFVGLVSKRNRSAIVVSKRTMIKTPYHSSERPCLSTGGSVRKGGEPVQSEDMGVSLSARG